MPRPNPPSSAKLDENHEDRSGEEDFPVNEHLDQLRKSQRGAWLSLVTYTLLAAVKIGFGWWAGSQALMADGFNNSTDILVSLAVLFGLRIALQPPDSDHPYGHLKAETIASMIAGIIIAVVGLQVLLGGLRGLWVGKAEAPDEVAMWVALASGFLAYGLYLYNLRLARHTKSQALESMALDNRSDAWVSLGAAAGITVTQQGYYWVDPLIAAIVGGLILHTAWGIFKKAIFSLTDGFHADKLRSFHRQISRIEGVEEIKEIRARYQGSLILVDVTITVMHDLSVQESHDITERIERALMDNRDNAIAEVHVHVEPAAEPSTR